MQIRRIRDDESELRRFVEECWLPYHEEVADTVDAHSTIEDLEVQDGIEFVRDRLDTPSTRLWVALDGVDGPIPSLSTTDATVAGFVRTKRQPSPQQFDWSDKLAISDVWVAESDRGSGLADDLLARAAQQAREGGCEALTLDVPIENERAVAYLEARGFEVRGLRMRAPVADVALKVGDGDPTAGDRPYGDDSSVHLRRLRVDDAVVDRFVDECWIPFWRALEAATGEDHLSPDLDRKALIDEFLQAYDVPDRRCWVALDDVADPTAGLAEIDATVAGWLNAGLEPGEPFLDPPERLYVGNLYGGDAYRGSGLADFLVARAIQYAREEGCVELSLDVDVANERAMAYYEKLGFDPYRQGMSVPLDVVDL